MAWPFSSPPKQAIGEMVRKPGSSNSRSGGFDVVGNAVKGNFPGLIVKGAISRGRMAIARLSDGSDNDQPSALP